MKRKDRQNICNEMTYFDHCRKDTEGRCVDLDDEVATYIL